MRIAPTVLVLAFAATAAFGAEVYRSKDANGNVTFSDRPEDPNAVAITVLTPKSGRPAAPPPQPRPVQKTADAASASNAPGGATAKPKEPPQTPEEHQAEKAKNCEIARQRVQSYAVSHRLYREGPNGERQYLNDKEIDEAKARAAADVETWCN